MTHIDDVIRQKRDNGMRIFFPKCLSDPGKQLQPWSQFHKNNVKGLKIAIKCQKVAFFCSSFINHLYIGRFTKTWLTTPQPHLTWANQGFSESSDPSTDY